jgi:hypothetical protein
MCGLVPLASVVTNPDSDYSGEPGAQAQRIRANEQLPALWSAEGTLADPMGQPTSAGISGERCDVAKD